MRLASVIVAAMCLAACGQSGSGDPAAEAGGGSSTGGFPNLFQTAYRAEATITNPADGRAMPVVMIRDGQRMRMEMTGDQGPVAIVINHETGESFMIAQMGGRQMVLQHAQANAPAAPEEMWSGDFSSTATRVGGCAEAGEQGTEWQKTDDGGDSRGCVTGDGIILWASTNGQRTWQTTSVQRGPQDAALFAVPEGAQVMNLGNLPGMAEALEKAKSGQ